MSRLQKFLGVSLPLYALLAVLSFRGVVFGGTPQEAAGSIFRHETDYWLQGGYVAVSLALSAVWLASLSRVDDEHFDDRTLLLTGAALGVLALAAFPGVGSNDIMAYVGYGRIMAVHHENPWTHAYGEFADAYAAYAWYPHPMPYGPVVAPLFAVAGYLSQHSVPLAFYFLKLCWLAAHLASGWLILRVARALSRPSRLAAWTFLTCPLLLVELVNNGHSDGLLVLFELLSLDALTRGDDDAHAGGALLLAGVACLVKPTAVLLLAAEGAWLVRQRRWKPLLAVALVASGVAAVLLATLFASSVAREALLNPHLLTNAHSFHSILFHLFVERDSPTHAMYLFAYDEARFGPVRAAVAGVFALFCAWRLMRVRTRADVIGETVWMTVALMLFYSARVWPWYVSWLLGLTVLSDDAALRRFGERYSVTMLAVYAIPFSLCWRSLPWHIVRVLLSSGVPLAGLAIDEARQKSGAASRMGQADRSASRMGQADRSA